jgi:hypothetical protein
LLGRLIVLAHKSKDPHLCARLIEGLCEIGQGDAEVIFTCARRALARLDDSSVRDAALGAIRPLIEGVEEGRGSRQKRASR